MRAHGGRSYTFLVSLRLMSLALILSALPLRAAPPPDFSFAAALDAQSIASDAAAAKRRARWDGRLRKWLGPFDAALAAPGRDAAAMAREAAAALAAGRHDALILGESHGEPAEQTAAGLILRAVAASPRPIGAILIEPTQTMDGSTQYIYADTGWLQPAGIAVLGYRAHFTPGPDLRDGLKTAGERLLVSYTGSAHSAKRVKDYILQTLDIDIGPFGRTLDMMTVEDALRGLRRKPLTVAMVSEAFILGRLEGLVVSGIMESEDRLDGAIAELDAAARAWDARFQAYPPAADIRFVPCAAQADLYLGLTPADRGPARLKALLDVLRAPEFAAWLGDRKIKSLEAGPQSSRDGAGRVIQLSYRVVVRDHKGGAFERTIVVAP